jgi:cytochrome b subunit of formate dehydrogenase
MAENTKIDSSTTQPKGDNSVYNELISQAEDLIYWKNPIKSGLVFVTGLFTFFVLTVGGYTVISLTSNLLLWLLIISFAYTNGTMMFATFQGKSPVNPHISRWGEAKFDITKETVDEYVDFLLPYVNKGIDFAREVAFCLNNMKTLKVIGALWVISIFSNLFSGLTLLFLEFFLAFSIPRLYEMNKQQVDKYADIALTQSKIYYKQVSDIIKEKIPKGISADSKKKVQ